MVRPSMVAFAKANKACDVLPEGWSTWIKGLFSYSSRVAYRFWVYLDIHSLSMSVLRNISL